jgi:tryptophan-rich sensory protein
MNSLAALGAWLVLCFAVAGVGAVASANAGVFYAELARPDWAPPAWLFGPVWTFLYAAMGVAAWLVWRTPQSALRRAALTLFLVQLAVNALWSWLFFAWRQGAWSFADIVLLWVLIVATLVAFLRVRRVAGLLLVPYLAWVTFAAVLNWTLWGANPALLALAAEAR